MPFPPLNSPAPDFTLPDQHGDEHSLSSYRGEWVLLYFYPKDDSTGCTKEACSIRDAFPSFRELHVKVLGVSTDSAESHELFAEKYDLPFTLLADADKKVVELYGVHGAQGTKRTSFLIDPNGMIAKIYENVKPETHVVEVLADLRELKP